MGKAIALITILAIMWLINAFVVRIVGLCFGVNATCLQATGVLVALLWIRIVCGGGGDR